MNKSQIVFLALILCCINNLNSQSVHFGYDDGGNRIIRNYNKNQESSDDEINEESGIDRDLDDTDKLVLEQSEIELWLFPNPVVNNLTLEVVGKTVENLDIEIWNSSGQLIVSEQINSALNQIDVSDLAAGVYVLKAILNDETKEWSIIKQN